MVDVYNLYFLWMVIEEHAWIVQKKEHAWQLLRFADGVSSHCSSSIKKSIAISVHHYASRICKWLITIGVNAIIKGLGQLINTIRKDLIDQLSHIMIQQYYTSLRFWKRKKGSTNTSRKQIKLGKGHACMYRTLSSPTFDIAYQIWGGICICLRRMWSQLSLSVLNFFNL